MKTVAEIRDENIKKEAERIRKYAEGYEMSVTEAIGDMEKDEDYFYSDWYCVKIFQAITGRLTNDLEIKEMRLSKYYKGVK